MFSGSAAQQRWPWNASGAECSGQGAHEGVVCADMGKVAHFESQVWQESRQALDRVLGEMNTRDPVEWLVEEELRGQRVLAALAQDMGTRAAKETFRRVFFRRETPFSAEDGGPMQALAGTVEGHTHVGVGVDMGALLPSSGGNDASPSN